MTKFYQSSVLAAALLLAACVPHRPSRPAPASPEPRPAAESSSGTSSSSRGIKPYSRVITRDAETTSGLFKTHRIGEKLYFEIPPDALGKEMLLVGRLVKGAPQVFSYEGYGGDKFTEQAVMWERVGDRVLLRRLSYTITADPEDPVARSVEAANNPGIIASFQVEAYGPDSAAVIDVTRLYTTSVPHVQALEGNIDEKRSFIERAQAFPDNVVVEATQTVPLKVSEQLARTGAPQVRSVVAHWSMIRLPEEPMRPRLYDDRVGYFTVAQYDFSAPEHRALRRQYITRYRLEKKDPDAPLSEPVRPIVYYIDPATPKEWVPYIKQGIEDWQVAFEAAGFKNAIIAKDAPTPEEDPHWSPDDVRYTVVRWLASTMENAQGPRVVDPRTGEILNGSVRIFHNILTVLRDMYFAQAAALDPRARRLPLPDSLMGRLLRYVVAHEIGHTLGLQHNFKAASTYPADSLRSRSWLERMGHVPSIMSYTRFNYVVQPEDGIDPELLVPRVGPYDIFAIRWGYAPIPEATTPEEELPGLDEWARAQDTVPWYRFATSDARGADAGEQTESVGASDPIRSTRLGLRNLERTVPLILPAAMGSSRGNDDVARLYQRVVRQWATELSTVVKLVGGMETQEKANSQPGPRFVPLPGKRQREAVAFLNEHAFSTPHFLLDPAILRRIEPDGALSRIRSRQASILSELLDNARMLRLIEFEALATRGADVYPLADMLRDVRRGLFRELGGEQVRIDPFRRNLQFAYLEEVGNKLKPGSGSSASSSSGGPRVPVPDEAKALLRAELADLRADVRRAIPRAADRVTRAHLQEVEHRIATLLDPDGR